MRITVSQNEQTFLNKCFVLAGGDHASHDLLLFAGFAEKKIHFVEWASKAAGGGQQAWIEGRLSIEHCVHPCRLF